MQDRSLRPRSNRWLAALCMFAAAMLALGIDAPCAKADLMVGSTFGGIQRFDETTGAYLGTLVPTGSGGLSYPAAFTYGPDNLLYISSNHSSQVNRYHPTTGAFVDTFVPANAGGYFDPYGLLFGPDKHLYLATGTADSVRRFDGLTGAFIDEFVPPGSGGTGYNEGIAFGPDGNLYVGSNANSSVKRFNGSTGAYIDDFVPSGYGGLVSPVTIQFGPDGSLYVCDFYGQSVRRYDGFSGQYLGEVCQVHWPSAIAFGPDQQLYVACRYLGVVKRFDPTSGAFLGDFAYPPGASELLSIGFTRETIATDTTAPEITITSPAESVYILNQPVIAEYSSSDEGSGVASTVGTTPNGSPIDTSGPGTKAFSVTAVDNAGNMATRMVNYRVAYGVKALYDQTKAHRRGSTAPIKVQLTDASGANVSGAAITLHATSVTQESNVATGMLDDPGASNPDLNFRYDASLGGYIFNLSLKGYSQGTYRLHFTAGGDLTDHVVEFQVR